MGDFEGACEENLILPELYFWLIFGLILLLFSYLVVTFVCWMQFLKFTTVSSYILMLAASDIFFIVWLFFSDRKQKNRC
jgi:hypothetical protein